MMSSTNLGEWIDTLDAIWILDELVPVCFKSAFSIKSSDLSQTPKLFKTF